MSWYSFHRFFLGELAWLDREPLAAPARRLLVRVLCAAMLSLPGAPALAGVASAMITIADGPVSLVRGLNLLPAPVGLKVLAGDILRVNGPGFLRVETDDGVRLDLGPGTELLWLPGAPTGASPRLAYLQSGWLKLSAPTPRGDTPIALGSALLDIDEANVTLMAADSRRLFLFAESGGVRARERATPTSPDAPIVLKPGEIFVRARDQKSSISVRPPPEFVAQLPRPFLDTLPARHAQLASREVLPKPGKPVTYLEIAGWLQAEPALRRSLMPRWRPLLADAGFRSAIVANLKLHPEWERALAPDRSRPQAATGQQPEGNPPYRQ